MRAQLGEASIDLSKKRKKETKDIQQQQTTNARITNSGASKKRSNECQRTRDENCADGTSKASVEAKTSGIHQCHTGSKAVHRGKEHRKAFASTPTTHS